VTVTGPGEVLLQSENLQRIDDESQDPNDESADKLLERIAQARKEAEALAKATKKAEAAKKKVAKSV